MPRGKKKITRKHRGGGNGANGFPTAPPAPQNQLMEYPAGSYCAGTFPNGFWTPNGYYIYLPPESPYSPPPPPTLFASGQAGAGRYPPTYFPNGFWAVPPGYYPDLPPPPSPAPPPAPSTSEMSLNQMKARLQQIKNQQTRNSDEALAKFRSSQKQRLLNQGKAAEKNLKDREKALAQLTEGLRI